MRYLLNLLHLLNDTILTSFKAYSSLTQVKRRVPSSWNLNNIIAWKGCELEGLVCPEALFWVKATLSKFVLAACNYLTIFSKKKSVFVATADLCNLRLNFSKSTYQFRAPNTCTGFMAELSVFVVSPAVNLLWGQSANDATGKVIAATDLNHINTLKWLN